MMKTGVLARHKDFLPLTAATPSISLGEGDTPMVRCRGLEDEIGCQRLYFKLEGSNPSGSFKDRGMVVAVAKAVEAGHKAVICASTGNTSASASSYAAHTGLESVVVIPSGKIAPGKLAQAIVYGAKIIAIDGNFDQALGIVCRLSEKQPVALVNSLNPHRIEGQKTAAFEIVVELGEVPDYLFIPVGNAGNITAYWKGFKEYHRAGRAKTRPKMMGFQAEGAAPIVRGQIVEKPETIASAIRIGNPASWQQAIAARDESGGVIDMVSDEEITTAYHRMASSAGIFGELASAASFAGLVKLAGQGKDFTGSTVVCVVTGSGLKDTEIAIKGSPSFTEVAADITMVERALGWD
jgi:threonine synthase